MRRGTLRKLLKKTTLTWNQMSGAYDPKSGVVGYRTIEGREYKEPTDPRFEKAAVDRILAAANKRRRKAGLESITLDEEQNHGTDQASERWTEGSEGRATEAPELDFGSFLPSE